MNKSAQPSAVAETIDPTLKLDQSQALDLLKMEYTALLGLYTHTENTLFGIFNFYLTLLSAIVGAIVVLIQINSTNLANSIPSISGLLMLTVLIGVIMQAAIVNKNIDLSIYALGINLLKHRLFRSLPDEMSNIFFLHNFWAKVHPIRSKNPPPTTVIHQRFWWLFPMGTHQLFIGAINSLSLAALVIIAAQLFAGSNTGLQSLAVAGLFVVILSFEIQAIYVRLKHRRGFENVATTNGSEIVWKR